MNPLTAFRGAIEARLPPSGPETAFLGLGGNMGERLRYLSRAVEVLDADRASTVDDVSSVYETAPVGPSDAPYLNIAVRLTTTRSPHALLRLCQATEHTLGRVRTGRWAARTLDVDVLLYGDRVVRAPHLQVPHPRLTERGFALVPLIEIAPGWTLPDGSSLTAAVAALAPLEGIDAIGRQIHPPGRMPDRPSPPGWSSSPPDHTP